MDGPAAALACLALGSVCPVASALGAELPSVLVEGSLPSSTDLTLDADSLAFARVTTNDTVGLLPGANVAQGGGVSSLPVLHGLADDRIRTLVDGVPASAACPMHMNPALSYIDPSNVERIDVLPGVTPVSLGGDSIGGTIAVESPSPAFASDDAPLRRSGSVASFYRSNGSALAVSASASAASPDASLAYQGSGVRAADYEDGNGERIYASRLEDSNQQLTFATRAGADRFELQAGVQDMPYEGFPNADMDLTGNVATFINARYWGVVPWGRLSVGAYFDGIHHQMNGDAPDRYLPAPVDITSMGVMPTRERGEDFGYRVELDVAGAAGATWRLGSELHVQTLDDRWPGAPVGMPFDYVSLDHGERTQLGTFAEWQRSWGAAWSLLLGVRNDTVWMNTGPVQGYDGLDPTAGAFNSLDRARTDFNVDASALTRYRPDDTTSYSFGLARKNRSPNLYERYAWGTSTIGMITWFGDGNGYTGNPELKPETAYTLSASGQWHDASGVRWQAELTPYYTYVENYIGVVPLCGPQCSGVPAAQLAFVNHDARLYGIDSSAHYQLASSERLGAVRLRAAAGFVRGRDLSIDTPLYRMMPLNGTIGLEHQRGAWMSRLELRAVAAKSDVDVTRLEPPTPGYATVELHSAYAWRALRLDLAVTNLLDRQYADPLGGRWQSGLYPPGFAGAIPPLPGLGRSVDLGVTWTL
ncbi:MAG TPA: TonB-dependent receptor [Steroidobacteraceae bacterium]|nr:TonB-dependent receptor [Steroidobacteraceae bacterium]